MAIRKCKSLPTLLKHNDNDQIEHDSDTNSTLSIPDFPFEEDYSRFIFFPIRYRAIWQLYKKAEASFWMVEEIDLSKDIVDWERVLKNDERFFITRILAFFATANGIINENPLVRFATDIGLPEARCFYGFQMMMENIHAETYTFLITTLIANAVERQNLFEAVIDVPTISAKARWCLKWISSDMPYTTRLVAFAAAEGIFFSSSFASIFWLKKRGSMPGLVFSNQLISRDEALHTEFACLMFSLARNKPTVATIMQIVEEAVELERNFVKDALHTPLIGMSAENMCQYVEYVADRLLLMIGLKKHYHSANPFTFMEIVLLEGKTNFFERKVSGHHMASVWYDSTSYESSAPFSMEEPF